MLHAVLCMLKCARLSYIIFKSKYLTSTVLNKEPASGGCITFDPGSCQHWVMQKASFN